MTGWLDLAVKTSALALTAAMAIGLMRRASAASRHLLWTGMFAGALLLPIARFTLPALTILVWPAEDPAPISTAPAETLSPIVTAAAVVATPPGASIPVPVTPTASGAARLTPETALLWLWLAGGSLFVLRVVAGTIGVRRAARRAAPVTDATLLTRLEGIRADFGVRRPIALYVSEGSWMPTTWGILQPAILLPQYMVASHAASPDPINTVLVHEVAHIARFDALSQLIARLGVALWWFNPLFWIAAREARFERECACDDAVLTRGSRASDYAGQLIGLARSMKSAPGTSFGAVAMARASELEHRVRAILQTKANRSRRSRTSLLATSVLLVAMVPIAAVRLGARPASTAESVTARSEINEPLTLSATTRTVPVAAVPRQPARQEPLSLTSQLTWPQERIKMLTQLYGMGAKFYADVLKMVEIGTEAAFDEAPLKEALVNVESFLRKEQETPRSPVSETDKEAIRASFKTATSQLDRLQVLFVNGLMTSRELADALNAAVNTLKEPGDIQGKSAVPSGTNPPGSIEQLAIAKQRLADLLVSRTPDNPAVRDLQMLVAALEKQQIVPLIQRLETSAQVYFSDARSVMTWHPVEGAALSRSSSDEIFTAETLCVFSGTQHNPANGWRITVTPLSESPGALVVRVDWQRSKDRTHLDNLPKTSVQVTLKPGDSIPLDYIVAEPIPKGETCNAVGMLLRIGLKADGIAR